MPDAKIPFFSFPVLGNLGPEYNGINAKNRQHGAHYDLHGKLTTWTYVVSAQEPPWRQHFVQPTPVRPACLIF